MWWAPVGCAVRSVRVHACSVALFLLIRSFLVLVFARVSPLRRARGAIQRQLQVELHFRHSVVAFLPHLTRCFCTCLVCLTLLLALWHLWCHFSFVLRALVTHCTVCPCSLLSPLFHHIGCRLHLCPLVEFAPR